MSRTGKKTPTASRRKKSPASSKRRGAPPAKKAVRKKTPAARHQGRGTESASWAGLLRRWIRRGFSIFWKCAALLLLITVAMAGAYRFINPPITGLMIMRHFGDGYPIDKEWCDYEDVSPHLLLAVLAAEDQRFYDHHGFDVKEIRNAIEEQLNDGQLRGASTLSQQTAKNVFLWPIRSWWRKGVEAYFTVLIEVLWPKQRILEVYVNVAEMGPGIYGVESAAGEYFNTSASNLKPEQAALLASILPSPLTRDPRKPTAYMRDRQAWILKQMNNLGGVRFLEQDESGK